MPDTVSYIDYIVLVSQLLVWWMAQVIIAKFCTLLPANKVSVNHQNVGISVT